MATVSVIIPCYNARSCILEALASVQIQAVDDLETIVVDDGSTDGSADLVEGTCPYVRVIRIENGGPSRARNVGTEAASGEFLQYLDADDKLAPGKIQIQLTALEQSHADVAYGGWQILIETPDGQQTLGKENHRQLGDNPEAVLLTSHFWCPPATYLFRRSMVEKIGGWNETLPIVQDARFVMDCALYDGQFTFCLGIMAYYRIHSGPSVSRCNHAAFLQDCLRNAEQLEIWWRARGGLNDIRVHGLMDIYQQVARGSYREDMPTYMQAYDALNRLQPNYIPQNPRPLAWATRLFGYHHAEEIAYQYRRVKRVLIGLRPKPRL